MNRLVRRATTVAVVAVLVVTAWATAASAAAERAGSVTITDEGGSKALASGASATGFIPKLPAEAACQGDSLNDGYRVQSFMIPEGDDPSTLAYENLKPVGDGRYPLYTATTSGYRQQLTLPNDEPGRPGLIGELPVFAFTAFEGSPVQAGTYRVGFACTLDNQTTRYWDTVLVLSRSSDTSGPQFSWTWAEAGSAGTDSGSSSSGPLLWIVLGVVLVAAVVVLVLWRRSSTTVPPSSKELS